MIPVDAASFRVTAQSVRDDRIAQTPNHRRKRGSNCRRTLIEILLHATDEIIGERLSELCLLGAILGRYITRILAACHRVEQSDCVATSGATGDLSGPQNRRVVRCVGERGVVADVAVQLRWPADATRIEEVEARGVAAEGTVHPTGAQAVASRDEGWTPFRRVRFH